MIPSQKVLIPFLLLATILSATDSCALSGTVMNSASGEPIPRVKVNATGASATSDSQGKWTVSGACGIQRLLAQRPGFIQPVQIGFTLKPGESRQGIVLQLTPQAIIAGRVTDDLGDPIMSAQILLFNGRIAEGRFSFQPAGGTQTNDLGEYRIPSLRAGKYLICVNLLHCFPGSPDGNRNSALEVIPGRESRVNFTVPEDRTVHFRGTVAGRKADARMSVMAFPKATQGTGGGQLQSVVRPDGSFDIAGVRPGTWYVATDYFDSGKRLVGRIEVEAGNADIDGMVIQLDAPGSIRGAIHSPAAISLPLFGLTLRALEPRVASGPIRWAPDDRTFTFSDVMLGKYRLDIVPPPGYYVKGARLNGEDVLPRYVTIRQAANILDLELAADGGTLIGEITIGEITTGEITRSTTEITTAVLLIPRRGQPKIITATADGHFTATDLAPGEYTVSAWDRASDIEYLNADWMNRYGGETTVAVSAGQTTRVTLKRQLAPPL